MPLVSLLDHAGSAIRFYRQCEQTEKIPLCIFHFWLALQIRIKSRQRDCLFVFHSTIRTKLLEQKIKGFCVTRAETPFFRESPCTSEVQMKLHEASMDRVARLEDQKMHEPFSAIKVTQYARRDDRFGF